MHRRQLISPLTVALMLVIAAGAAACAAGDDDRAAPQPNARPEATPHEGLVAVRAVPWTTATVAADRKTVRVDFTEGEDGCNVFARAEHRRAGNQLIVTLYAGNEPDAASCDTLGPEFGIAKQVVIPLDEAAPDEIVDGGE